jgi:geranylgeranyl diphosphate synthase, type II
MSDSTFLDNLSHTKKLVWPIIENYLKQAFIFPDYCLIPEEYQPELDFHSQIVNDYPLRQGKYLRPTLVLNTALSMGGSQDLALPVAAAMQLSEEWILLHDDIEDDSLQRRGAPTLHKTIGKELAINAGDNLQTIQWHILHDALPQFGASLSQKILNEFYVMFNRTYLGQTIDIKWNQSNKLDITDEDVFMILESKTCYYTISGPMRLGAIVAGASDENLDTIYLFGRYLGRAFQIIDDILDLTSDFSGQKKQPYNDIYEGKRTIPLSHLLKSADPSELKVITDILAKSRDQKSETEVIQIIELMNKYKTIDSAKTMAIDFSVEAKKILKDKMDFIRVEPFRQQLESAIDFVVDRSH